MRIVLHHALVLSVAAGALSAQNLVVNGDFESGLSNGAPKGWTVTNIFNGKVDKFATDGGTSSNSWAHNPGGSSFPNTSVNTIEQEVVVTPVTHEFRCDVASVAQTTNASGGVIEVFVDNVSIGKFDFGSIQGGGTERTRICFRFKPAVTGKKMLKITYFRSFLGTAGTPVVHTDNIFLGPTAGPTICFPGERKIGSKVTLNIVGSAGHQFALFAGFQSEPGRVIPGWSGRWVIASPIFPLVIGSLDSTGLWSVSATLTYNTGFRGNVLLQAVSAKGTQVDMGFGQFVNIY